MIVSGPELVWLEKSARATNFNVGAPLYRGLLWLLSTPDRRLLFQVSNCQNVGVTRPLSVFVIDDSQEDVELISSALSDQEVNVQVIVCTGGSCADDDRVFQELEKLGNDLPDLILLDLYMPPQSGLDLLTRLKNDVRYQVIPVVVLSNSEEQKDINEAYRRHAAAYLTKAVTWTALHKELASLIAFWQKCRLPVARID